jgi:GDPmannose 4,6-dehydratase
MTKKKALIIGISGQDGAFLSDFLLSQNYEVHGSSRDAQMHEFRGLNLLKIKDKVTVHSLNTKDFRNILEVLKKVQPDEIYNLSGQSSVGLSFEQPVETFESIAVATLNLLEAIKFLDKPIRFYNAGSSECFGETSREGANEKTPFNPLSPYATAKATSFWQIANYRKAYGLYACTGILFNHESYFRPARFVTQKIIKTALRIERGSGEKLELGNLDIHRDWGWAPDYVKAMWLMLQQDNAEDYIVASGVTNSLRDFVKKTFEYLNMDAEEHVISNKSFFRPSDISFSLGDPRLAQAKLGWKTDVILDEIISRMIDFEKSRS